MSSKGLISALACKCPQCRKGEVFTASTYSPKFHKINAHCPSCGLEFEVEPGFFIGAMYVNYGFTVAQVITIGFLVNFLIPDAVIWHFMGFTIASILVFLPLTFRLSKSLYLYWFSGVKFRESK